MYTVNYNYRTLSCLLTSRKRKEFEHRDHVLWFQLIGIEHYLELRLWSVSLSPHVEQLKF